MAGKADIVNGIVDVTTLFAPGEDEDGSASVESSISTTDDKYSSKPGG